MPDTFNIQVRIGRSKITMSGATSYEVTEGSGPPNLQVRAPKGSRTIVHKDNGNDAQVIIHATPYTTGHVGIGPEKTD